MVVVKRQFLLTTRANRIAQLDDRSPEPYCVLLSLIPDKLYHLRNSEPNQLLLDKNEGSYKMEYLSLMINTHDKSVPRRNILH